MRNVWITGLLAWSLAGLLPAADDRFVLSDFEKDGDKAYEAPPQVTLAKEHAKSGAQALKILHTGEGYHGITFDKKDQLAKFGEFPMFKMDIFNPHDFTVVFTASAGDAKSTNYVTRYNNDGLAAKPGWSTLQINLTGLTRSNSNNFHQKEALDAKSLTFLKFFLCPNSRKEPTVLYFDDPRLEGDGLPGVEGLHAFDFGPAKSAVFPGFTGVNEKTKYSPEAGYGWQGSTYWHKRPSNPDDLGGDYGSGDLFVADLKSGAGTYVVEMCIDAFGEWQTGQFFTQRSVELNGKQVHTETLDGSGWLKQRYLAYEDDEDTPGMDLWEKRVKPFLPVRRFEAEVAADGKLSVKVASPDHGGKLISFLVVYPKAKETEGKAYMEALEKVRAQGFRNEVVLSAPKPEREAPKPSGAEASLGFITFVRSAEADITCASAPSDSERGTGLEISACAGERAAAQVGLYPLKTAESVKITAGDLTGPNGAKIPASAVMLRKIRYFAKRAGGGNAGVIVPHILQPLETVKLEPGLTRGIWITLTVPADAAPGAYAGELSVDAAGRKHPVPVKLSVLPFALDKADDLTISCTGTTAGHWRGKYLDLEERWWQIAEDVMRDLAEHGMNAVTGGPAFNVTAVKDGKAVIDFSDADRWLALAAKHGLTRRGDSYQGLGPVFGFWHSQDKDCMKTNDDNARRIFGIGFEELVKATFVTVAAHAKEKNWPARVYYLLDEPRPEFGNVEAALELTKLFCRAAPDVKFSGYYSPGDGRDPYFKTMPVTIAHHHEESIKWCTEAGKEAWTYVGGGARYDIGRWLFYAKSQGLSGFLRNGYQYVNSSAYYDFSDTEGSWAQVYPSRHGIAATLGWERTALGVNDYRYLKTLCARLDAARKDGKLKEESAAAESFLAGTLKGITIHDKNTADLKPDQWRAFRADAAKHITALSAK